MDELAPNQQDRRARGADHASSPTGRATICATPSTRRKIAAELGWEPRETFETGLRKTVEWYLDNRTWWERIRSGVYRGERLGVVA